MTQAPTNLEANSAPKPGKLDADPRRNNRLISYTLNEQINQFQKANRDNDAGVGDWLAEAGYNLAYQGSQSWIKSSAQVLDDVGKGVDNLLGTGIYKENLLSDATSLMPKPEERTYRSSLWYAQQVGSGLGYSVPFAITHNARTLMGLSVMARTEASIASTGKLISAANGVKMADSSATGFLTDFLFRPLEGDETQGGIADHLKARAKHGATGATFLGSATTLNLGLRYGTRSVAAALVGPGMDKMVARGIYDAGAGAISSVPAGAASADVTAGLEHGRFATREERDQSMFTSAFTGGALGVMHVLPRDQKAVDIAVANRTRQVNLEGLLEDSKRTKTIRSQMIGDTKFGTGRPERDPRLDLEFIPLGRMLKETAPADQVALVKE